MNNTSYLTLSTLVLGTLISPLALAQQEIEVIEVSATKRAESIQEVPISIIAMSGEAIQDMSITRAEEFAANIPAVTIAQNVIGNFVFIRGVGTPGANQGIEHSVAIFHDGIYMGRSQLSRAPFMDLERVEVLRGPQSTLFGKNTIGGAVHVIAAKPTFDRQASISALIGSDGEQEINAMLSGEITDELAGRIAYRGYKLDGYLDNVLTGKEGPERDDQSLRVQLAWFPTDDLKVSAKWEESTFDQVQQSSQLAVTDPIGTGVPFSALNQALVAAATGGDGAEQYDKERAVDNDGGVLLGTVAPDYANLPGFPDKPEFSDNKMKTGTLTFDWDIGDHTLTAISGYAHYTYQDICDCDFAAIPLIQVDATEDYDQYSQEIRVASPGGEKFDYIAGVYFHKSTLEYRSIEGFGTSLAAPLVGQPAIAVPNLTRDYGLDQDQSMWSIFGSGTYSFTDSTRVTLGVRYFDETKEVDHFLDKTFTGGWDYSAVAGLPAGSLVYGDTAAEYDRFLTDVTDTPLSGLADLSEFLFAGLLGTFEHDIKDREREEKDWNWSLTVENDLSDGIMAFATVATGTKGGGFDGRFLGTNEGQFFEYEEEKATSYELGLKSFLFDNAMILNAALFYSTIDDFQVSIFDGATAFFVQNAAEIETKGLEVDMKWSATDSLLVSFAGSILDNEYSNFPNAPCHSISGSEPIDRGNCIGRGTPTAFRDASGEANSFAPDLAFNLNFNYVVPLSNALEFRGILNINYSDEYFNTGDLDPIYAQQEAFTKVDVRFSLGSAEGDWEVALIGKNLTDELTSDNSNDQPLVPGNGFASTNRGRSVAVQFSYRFFQ